MRIQNHDVSLPVSLQIKLSRIKTEHWFAIFCWNTTKRKYRCWHI